MSADAERIAQAHELGRAYGYAAGLEALRRLEARPDDIDPTKGREHP